MSVMVCWLFPHARTPARPTVRHQVARGGLHGSRMTSLVPYLGPATLEAVKRLVLDAVSSPSTRTMYAKALDDFFLWRAEQGSPAFSRAAVQAHRAALEA